MVRQRGQGRELDEGWGSVFDGMGRGGRGGEGLRGILTGVGGWKRKDGRGGPLRGWQPLSGREVGKREGYGMGPGDLA